MKVYVASIISQITLFALLSRPLLLKRTLMKNACWSTGQKLLYCCRIRSQVFLTEEIPRTKKIPTEMKTNSKNFKYEEY